MYSRSRRRTHSGEVRRDSLKKSRPNLGGNWFCLLENIFLYIKCKKTLNWLYKRINVCLIHSKVFQECYWIANNVIKCLWIAFAQKCLSIVSNNFQDNVNDSNVGVNKSIFFSFVRRMTQMNGQNCYWMLIKMQKPLLNLIYAQMFAFSR